MRARGFTLIELMIVVAIIGILAAIIIPYLKGKGFEPIGQRTFSTTPDGKEVDSFRCHNGLLHRNGVPMVVNGKQVECN